MPRLAHVAVTLTRIAEAYEEAAAAATATPAEGAPGAAKRARGGANLPASTPTKRQRVDDGKIIEASAMTPPVKLLSVSLVGRGQDGLSLEVRAGNRAYIVNGTAELKELTPGMVLAGFGKGKFKLNGQGENLNDEACVSFTLETSSASIYHNNELTTVKEVVMQKRATEPLCKVAYHEMTEVSGEVSEVGAFSLKPIHQVYFLPAAASADESAQPGLTQAMVANAIPNKFWVGHTTDIVWATKWAINGLTPVRPMVLVTKLASIPAGKVLELF